MFSEKTSEDISEEISEEIRRDIRRDLREEHALALVAEGGAKEGEEDHDHAHLTVKPVVVDVSGVESGQAGFHLFGYQRAYPQNHRRQQTEGCEAKKTPQGFRRLSEQGCTAEQRSACHEDLQPVEPEKHAPRKHAPRKYAKSLVAAQAGEQGRERSREQQQQEDFSFATRKKLLQVCEHARAQGGRNPCAGEHHREEGELYDFRIEDARRECQGEQPYEEI